MPPHPAVVVDRVECELTRIRQDRQHRLTGGDALRLTVRGGQHRAAERPAQDAFLARQSTRGSIGIPVRDGDELLVHRIRRGLSREAELHADVPHAVVAGIEERFEARARDDRGQR